MQIAQIADYTRLMAVNQDEYENLPIRDEIVMVGGIDHPVPRMLCAFKPTLEECAALARGECIYLSILGTVFPPVLLTVGDPNVISDPTFTATA